MSQEEDDCCQTLSFDSFEQLQAQLLLMPRIDETGIGAVATANDCSVYKHVLMKLGGHDEPDLYNQEFSQILSAIREARTPFVCWFAPPQEFAGAATSSNHVSIDDKQAEGEKEEEEEEKKDDSSVEKEVTSSNSHEDEDGTRNQQAGDLATLKAPAAVDAAAHNLVATTTSSYMDVDRSLVTSSSDESSDSSGSSGPHKMQLSSPTWSDLSKWTTRMKQSSMEFSTVAASTAVNIAMAAKERANQNTAAAFAKTATAGEATDAANQVVPPPFSLFTHASSGAWLPLPKATSDAVSVGELVLTNSSVISVRVSATEPCLGKDYSFQWYCSCNAAANQEWQVLEGATNASFQPCATEVGHRLRCVIIVQHKNGGAESTDISDLVDQENTGGSCYCETGRVVASEQLFNGARQALHRGTSFGGLIGKDKASGRTFSIKVQTIKGKDENGNAVSTSAITMYKVSGKTAEPMHPEEEPVTSVIARVDHSTPKDFSLIFARGIPQSAFMVAALATDNVFTLQSSTRLGRETLLLTLGIANFCGKPADLSPSKILYDSPSKAPVPTAQILEFNTSSIEGHLSLIDAGSSSTPPRSSTSATTPERQTKRSEPFPSPQSNSTTSRTQERSNSLGSVSILSDSDDSTRTGELEDKVTLLRQKLERKNKVVADLQRQLAQSEALSAKKEQQARLSAKAVQQCESEKQKSQQSHRLAEKRHVALQESVKAMQDDHKRTVESMDATIASQSSKISELEKFVRTLQNEKAVLAAGVEAREGKLSRMEELQQSFSEMSGRIQSEDVLRDEIESSNRRCSELSAGLERTKKSLSDTESKVEHLYEEKRILLDDLELEQKKTASHHADNEALQLRIQKLVAERNNYKQKGDSLSKEMSRICRNGRSIRDVERILVDEVSLRQEVDSLREQKRRALDDLDHYRTAYEQSRSAQQMAGLDADTASILERNAELERLLSDLTEYLHAKEMQLETLMQINDALQHEMREAAKSTMSKNLSKNDV